MVGHTASFAGELYKELRGNGAVVKLNILLYKNQPPTRSHAGKLI